MAATVEDAVTAVEHSTGRSRASSRARDVTLRPMLLSGINHVATLTNDTDRLHAFYREVFEATIVTDNPEAHEGEGFGCRSSTSATARC